MEFVDQSIQRYAEDHTSPESPLLAEITRETHLHHLMPRMLSGHLQGRVLSMISHMIQPQYILEIGTYTGYSAICLYEGLQKDGKIVTIDINEELAQTVRRHLEANNQVAQTEFFVGSAHEIIPKLSYQWDLVFMDADKENYPVYFDLVIDQLKPGGFILADNVLWSGKVLDQKEQDATTVAIREFNEKIQADSRVENVLLPLRDGLLLIRKK